MEVVQFPNVVESYHRAIHEVLSPFLSTGNSMTLMGRLVHFYRCDLYFHIDKIFNEQHVRPFICFVGARIGAKNTEKNIDSWTGRLGYQVRQTVPRTIYVGAPRSLILSTPPTLNPINQHLFDPLDADTIWSQLSMVVEHQRANFRDRGIMIPEIPLVPAQEPSKDYVLLRGEWTCEIQVDISRNTTP
jgi:hypothetical protein